MSLTLTYSARIALNIVAQINKSGDKTGQDVFEEVLTLIAGTGTCPAVAGALSGDLSVTGAQDLLLADPTDPLQSCGVAKYSEDFAPAGKALFLLIVVNEDTTNSLKVARGAANGLPIFSAASDAIDLGPNNGLNWWYNPAGFGALTTGANDKVTLTPSAGTIAGRLLALYRA